jgi:hypothetical protein
MLKLVPRTCSILNVINGSTGSCTVGSVELSMVGDKVNLTNLAGHGMLAELCSNFEWLLKRTGGTVLQGFVSEGVARAVRMHCKKYNLDYQESAGVWLKLDPDDTEEVYKVWIQVRSTRA